MKVGIFFQFSLSEKFPWTASCDHVGRRDTARLLSGSRRSGDTTTSPGCRSSAGDTTTSPGGRHGAPAWQAEEDQESGGRQETRQGALQGHRT